MASSRARADILAGVVIVFAGALSAAWAFFVPIFQGVDEPAHFSYVMSLYDTGHLIRADAGPLRWIADPTTRYLVRAVQFERIQVLSSMHVAPDYGSRAYFARIDAGARDLRRPYYPSNGISYIIPEYPFGFYALEALWLKAVSLFTNAPTALFFAARLLCVFLTLLALFCNYRTALNLGMAPWLAVGVMAAVAFFPLTSYVSSSVQPDNLAYTLVSASLLFATTIRRNGINPQSTAGLGIALGLLAVTKYHFFVSAAIPTLSFVAMQLSVRQRKARVIIPTAAALLLPATLLLLVQYLAVGVPKHAATSDLNGSYISATFASGFVPGLSYVAHEFLNAFIDFYIFGTCAATYWQVVGLGDTPIIVINSWIESFIRAVISLMSALTFVTVLAWLARSGVRALKNMPSRTAVALGVLTYDPVIGSYALFTAIMFALYVVTSDAVVTEGRHWYPYVFEAFLCFAWYAPRSFGRRGRRIVPALTCVLLIYAVVAAAFALSDVQHRYYGPAPRLMQEAPAPSQILQTKAVGILNPVFTGDDELKSRSQQFVFPVGLSLQINGAAIIPERRAAASDIALVVDSRIAVPVLARQYVLYVGEMMHSTDYGYSGFHADLPTQVLSEGVHTVAAFARVPATREYEPVPPQRVFFLTAAPEGRFSGVMSRAFAAAPRVRGSVLVLGVCKGPAWFPRANPVAGALGRAVVEVRPVIRDPDATTAFVVVGSRPYPSRYFDHRFIATIPASDLSAGDHVVDAYLIGNGSRSYNRVDSPAVLQVGSAPQPSASIPGGSLCLDPFRQLAGYV